MQLDELNRAEPPPPPPAADDSMAALEALMASSDDGDGEGEQGPQVEDAPEDAGSAAAPEVVSRARGRRSSVRPRGRDPRPGAPHLG